MKNHFFFKIALILFLMTNYVGNASIIRVALEDVHHSLSRKYLKNTAQSPYTKQYLISPNEKAYPQFTTKLSFTERFNRSLKNLFQIAPQKYSKNPQRFVPPTVFEVKRILHLRRYDYLKTITSKLNFATKRHFHTSSTLRQEKKNSNELSSRGIIHISIQAQLTDEMDQLRLLCFPPASLQLTSRDEFDERSKHIAVYIDNIIAAYGRLTPGPRAVFETWSQGQAQIPTGEDVIDLGRCCVNPLYRGSLLYEAIILKGFQYAEKNNYKSVVGSYEPGRYVGSRLLKLGFKNSGDPVYETEPDGGKFLIQPVVFEIKPHHYDWERLIHHALYSSPDKFWKNLIHLKIQTLDESQYKTSKIAISNKVQFVIQDQLTDEMDQLRLQCFPPPSPQLTSRDEFDEKSKHVVAIINDHTAAYLRMTPGPNSVLEGWTNGQAHVPIGEDVIDSSRACVSSLFRGSLLYEAIILKGFQYATDYGFKHVVGSYEPNRYIGTRVKKLGFIERQSTLPV